jgi:integrase
MSVKVRPYVNGGWEVDITFRLPDGRRHRERRKAPLNSKSGALRWGQDRERHLLQHGPARPKKEVPTLADFSPRFLDGHARANRQKPGGIAHKESVLRVHVVPLLGAYRLDMITNEDVQRLKHALRHKSVKTVNNVLTVLNTLLKKAVEWDAIERVPCSIRLLKTPSGSVDFFDFDEYDRLVTAAQATDPRAHLIVLLAGQAGLRSGEIRALRWSDVNVGKRQLCVERGDWRGHVSATKGGRLRYVPLTTALMDALRAHRHLRSPLVLCRDDGRPLTENDVRGFVDRAARRAQLRQKGPHMLRHTFCSHLAMRGVPVRAIQELAGHQHLSTTQRYMHLSPVAIESAIRTLEQRSSIATCGDIVETASAEERKVNS